MPLTSLLESLADAGVEFVLVGALAAVAQGAPITTFDVDVVHARHPENIARLLRLLATIHARHRGQPAGRVLEPTADALAGRGHQLLMTDLGPLDLLGTIERGLGYQDLVPLCVTVELSGRTIPILGLETLVELKRGSTRPKDRAALAVLEETLARSKGRG